MADGNEEEEGAENLMAEEAGKIVRKKHLAFSINELVAADNGERRKNENPD